MNHHEMIGCGFLMSTYKAYPKYPKLSENGQFHNYGG